MPRKAATIQSNSLAVKRIEGKTDAMSLAVVELAKGQALILQAQASLLEAQTKLTEAVAAMATKAAYPPYLVEPPNLATELTREASRGYLHSRPKLDQEQILLEEARLVPRRAPEAPATSNGEGQPFSPPQSAAAAQNGSAPEPDPEEPEDEAVPVGTGSFADLAAELEEYGQEDEDPPPPPNEAEQFELWRRRMYLFQTNRMWLGDWGPRPGQDGCEVPAELLGR